jgi:hypothetical protein
MRGFVAAYRMCNCSWSARQKIDMMINGGVNG